MVNTRFLFLFFICWTGSSFCTREVTPAWWQSYPIGGLGGGERHT